MLKIHLKLETIHEDHYVHEAISSYLDMGNELGTESHLLDTQLLNGKTTEENLDLLEGFAAHWEMKASDEELEFVVDDSVDCEILELKEQLEIEEEKTFKRCEN